ncbi:nose resistant to fluoxetine protein 6-like [Anoplophora glabripennis]|uniref:nose resistant to fluoxetine protein 6-like n=1 Tax=Anoplophora glabripennis TaxID=217634 RepID=UPI0008756C8D|nr:nose resistant to fluoxetine protein 6-like [Anoplophora glabripennis]
MRAICFLVIFSITFVNGDIDDEETWQYEMLKMPDLRAMCEQFQDETNVGTRCKEQLSIVCGNITLLLAMSDASSKFPFTGLGYASKTDLGNFDQCLSIDHSYEGGRILGEHCMEGLVVPDPSDNISDANTYYTLSVCRPDGCNARDYNEIVEPLLDAKLTELFLDNWCQKAVPNKAFDVTEIVTLTIFAIITWLIVISTIYDVYIYKSNNKNNHPLLIAFSLLSNGRKLLHISKNSTSKEHIEILNGLRVISMMWIIAGHGFMSWAKVPVVNIEDWGESWTKHLYAGYILTAPLAVDTFFYMSGFLVAFKYLQRKEKSLLSQLLSIPQMYLHRFLRLTPALLMVYLVIISLFHRLGSGPLWEKNKDYAKTCRDNWSAVFLYIQNYYNYKNVCLPQTWFLSAVMQLFLISPLVLIPLSLTLRKPLGFKKAMVGLTILNIVSTFTPMVHKLYVLDYRNEYDSHSRLIDYFMGVMLAVFMRENMDKSFLYMVREQRKPVINLVIWILIILAMLATVMCYQLLVEMQENYKITVTILSLMRPMWSFGLSWIIYSSYHGYGGFVNWILRRPIFQILGRLTYSIYLVHQSVIDYNVITTRAPWYFTDYNAFYLFCGHYIVSVNIAIFWTLAFEIPFIALEKYIEKTYSSILERKSTQRDSNEEKQLQSISLNGTGEDLVKKCTNSEGLYTTSNEFLGINVPN